MTPQAFSASPAPPVAATPLSAPLAAARPPRVTPYRRAAAAQRTATTATPSGNRPALTLVPLAPAPRPYPETAKNELARRSRNKMPSHHEIASAITEHWFARYLAAPEPALDLATLWALHTHYRHPTPEGGQGHLAFRCSPRLFALSQKPGSGKSTYISMTGEVSANYFGIDQEPTEYGIIDALADEHATVCLDEGDILFGRGARKAGVRSAVQAYTYDVTKKTGQRGGTRKSMFGPIALAALDYMATTTGDQLDSTFDRAFAVRMEKQPAPADPDTRDPEEATLARKALRYVADSTMQQVLARAVAPDLPVPAELDTRARQLSRPIIAIAEAISEEWLTRAQRAVLYFRGSGAATPAQTAELAQDFRSTFLGV